ncbi:MAG: septum formation initiator family protein, partial [Candidatus Dormibacteria bacterium]
AAEGHSLDDRVKDLGKQNAGLRQQIADRKREISEAQSPAWLEGEARKLDYVLPGERTFVFPSPGALVPSAGGVDVKQLPVYPTPAPGAPGRPPAVSVPAAQPPVMTPTPVPSPTPYTFTLPPPPPAH